MQDTGPKVTGSLPLIHLARMRSDPLTTYVVTHPDGVNPRRVLSLFLLAPYGQPEAIF